MYITPTFLSVSHHSLVSLSMDGAWRLNLQENILKSKSILERRVFSSSGSVETKYTVVSCQEMFLVNGDSLQDF